MANEKVWPVDKLGNELREGDLVHLTRDQMVEPLFAVLKVDPATKLITADGEMPVNGTVRFGLFFEVPYMPANPQFLKAIVVKQPEEMQSKNKVGLQ